MARYQVRIRTCNPSGLLSLPPLVDLIYGFPVAGWRQLFLRLNIRSQTWEVLIVSLVMS